MANFCAQSVILTQSTTAAAYMENCRATKIAYKLALATQAKHTHRQTLREKEREKILFPFLS